MKNNTILFITTRLPFPVTSGRKTSLYHYCRIIKKLGYRLVVVSFPDDNDISIKPDFIDKLYILPKISIKTKLTNIIKYSIIRKNKPLQVSLYHSKKIQKKIDDIVEKENPKCIIGDMVRTAQYIKKYKDIYTISDLDDRLSLRYKRQLNSPINDVNPYGLFLNSLPKIIQKILLWNPIKKSVMKNEIKMLTTYELALGRETNTTVFVAKNESESFNNDLGEKKAITVPIGVDNKYFKYTKNIGNENDYIGFLGVLNVAHNENGVKHFIENIFPIIKEKNSNAKFLVIGGGANERLKKYESDSIIFTGRVDDVRTYLRKCKVFVCPLMFGSGIKTKNLEAMSLGIPVVTSIIGAENINAKNNTDWIVAENNQKFAEAVLSILSDDEKRKYIGKNGSIYVKNNFTWDIAKNEIEKILMKIE